jgi:hypothetical protein
VPSTPPTWENAVTPPPVSEVLGGNGGISSQRIVSEACSLSGGPSLNSASTVSVIVEPASAAVPSTGEVWVSSKVGLVSP